MVVFPRAKINIGLHITNKRSDGYHDLETLFFPTSVTDILEIVESGKTSINLYGKKFDGDPSQNICIKAYNLLKDKFKLPPVEISLYKKIPVGAGLGGGSSDGAHTLIVLNRLFNLYLTTEQLQEFALILGSDVPLFVFQQLLDCKMGEAIYATGRGELMSKMVIEDLRGCDIEVVTPPIFVSTATAYSLVKPNNSRVALKELLNQPIKEWKNIIKNDFEQPIFDRYPLIKEYKEKMYEKGAIYASMSGSGSSVFGIFPPKN